MKTSYILGTKINHDISVSDVVTIVETVFLTDGKSHQICTTNPEFVMEGINDSSMQAVVNNSDLSLADGSGVLYATKYLEKIKSLKSSNPLTNFFYGITLGISPKVNNEISKEKITGVGLTLRLCELSAKKGSTIFLLGGRPRNIFGKPIKGAPDLATLAAEQLKLLYPGVHIIGSTSHFSPRPEDDASTVKMIQDCMHKHSLSRLDFLFVACQHWEQEKWISRNKGKIPARVAMGVGGTFDIIVNNDQESFTLAKKHNMEWITKLFTQPFRYKRIYKAFPLFPVKVYMSSIGR